MAKTNKFNVPNGLMNQGKVADIPEFPFFLSFIKKQARKGFRPISASEGLLVRKVNNLINKRTEHWSCRIFVQQVK